MLYTYFISPILAASLVHPNPVFYTPRAVAAGFCSEGAQFESCPEQRLHDWDRGFTESLLSGASVVLHIRPRPILILCSLLSHAVY
jgi:hypothetical protein